VQRASDIPWSQLDGIATLGISAGASAPEVLVEEVIAAIRTRFDVTVETVTHTEERVAFNVPRGLRDVATEAEQHARGRQTAPRGRTDETPQQTTRE
jgi:4-hydroxy-3-methylbut-2-enyl diphosphate reductase